MKKVFVVGGSGRIATDLITVCVATGNVVRAGARRPAIVSLGNHGAAGG